jgi:hypothetical protein
MSPALTPQNYRARSDSVLLHEKSDVICPGCSAGYRRIELSTRPGKQGEFRCRVCNHLLELFDGSHEVAFRLTVQPAKYRDKNVCVPKTSSEFFER